MAQIGPKSRVLRAMLVALVLFLVAGGAVGFASADEGLRFVVPPPAGGDEATYAVEGSNEDPIVLSLSPVAPFLLEDGSWVSAYAVDLMLGQLESQMFGVTNVHELRMTVYVDAATGRPVASKDVVSTGGGTTYMSCRLPPFMFCTTGSDWQTERYLVYEPLPLPCGLRSSLQGKTTVGDAVRIEGCGEEGRAATFRVVGMRDLDGTPSLVVRNQGLGVSLWYWTGIPYPVRIVDSEGVAVRMIGFTPGTAALDPVVLPAPVVLPPIELAPAGRLGPDATGFDQTFALSDAVEQARQESQAVRDFMARHPDYFLTSADYEERDRDGNVSRQWSLDLHGGAERLRLAVSQKASPALQLPPPLADAVSSEGDNGFWEAEADVEWPESCRPETLPTVASVAARWAAREGRALSEANSWGMQLTCTAVAGAWLAEAEILAGDMRIVYPPAPGTPPFNEGSTNSTQLLNRLAVDERGGFAYLEVSDTATQRHASNDLPFVASSPAASQPEGSVGASSWQPPGTVAAAGIGVLAALGGLAYWLWPNLKGLALGLFSRVHGPKLLDHPVRAQLMQRIEAQPGIHYQALIRAMGHGHGGVEHHLRKLRESGLVTVHSASGYTCYFPAGTDRRVAATAPVLKAPGARRVLAAIASQPARSALDIGRDTGLSPATVHHHVDRLAEAGLVRKLRNGRSLSLEATAAAHAALAA